MLRAIIQDNVNDILTDDIIIRDSSDYIVRTMGRAKASKATKPKKNMLKSEKRLESLSKSMKQAKMRN